MDIDKYNESMKYLEDCEESNTTIMRLTVIDYLTNAIGVSEHEAITIIEEYKRKYGYQT